MNENFSNDDLMSKAQALIKSGNSFSEIEQLLAKENFEESKIKEIIKMVVSYKNKKRLKSSGGRSTVDPILPRHKSSRTKKHAL